MSKPPMDSLRFLKMLRKSSPDLLFFTSKRVPKGKCYVFTHSKGSDDAMKVFKHDQGIHMGYCVAVTLFLAIVGSMTLVNYSYQGVHWILKDFYVEKKDGANLRGTVSR